MLRYHNSLDSNEKLLSDESIKFYQTILDIDKLDNKDKFNMYMNLKDKNIALQFYNDLNSVKKHSYINIKKSLFKLDDKNELLNKEDSQSYGLPIYELNGEDFYMMISCMKSYNETSKARRFCCSLISSYNMKLFSKRRFVYGFVDFQSEDFLHVFEKDISSYSDFDSNLFTTNYVNRIMTPKQISNSSDYSEVQFINKVDEDNPNKYNRMRPSYLVVFDTIEDRHIIEAQRLNIPIVKINTSKYKEKIQEAYKQRNHLGFDKFEYVFDCYTNGSSSEKTKKSRR